MKNLRKGLVFSLVLLSVVSLGSVAGTYAKYTSNATGTDSARVAKWSFTVEGAETTATNEFTFDLFSTTYNNVAAKDNGNSTFDNVIAPGTEGEFTINLVNNSEVAAQYAIEYTTTNTNKIPVEFSVDNGNTWTTALVNVVASNETTMNPNGSDEEITIKWRWAFNGNDSANFNDSQNTNTVQTDANDTAFGSAQTLAQLTVSAKITATQVD